MSDQVKQDQLLAEVRAAIFAARDGGVATEEIESEIENALDDLDDPQISG